MSTAHQLPVECYGQSLLLLSFHHRIVRTQSSDSTPFFDQLEPPLGLVSDFLVEPTTPVFGFSYFHGGMSDRTLNNASIVGELPPDIGNISTLSTL